MFVRKQENIEDDISLSPGTDNAENKNNSNKKISPLRKTNYSGAW